MISAHDASNIKDIEKLSSRLTRVINNIEDHKDDAEVALISLRGRWFDPAELIEFPVTPELLTQIVSHMVVQQAKFETELQDILKKNTV